MICCKDLVNIYNYVHQIVKNICIYGNLLYLIYLQINIKILALVINKLAFVFHWLINIKVLQKYTAAAAKFSVHPEYGCYVLI